MLVKLAGRGGLASLNSSISATAAEGEAVISVKVGVLSDRTDWIGVALVLPGWDMFYKPKQTRRVSPQELYLLTTDGALSGLALGLQSEGVVSF